MKRLFLLYAVIGLVFAVAVGLTLERGPARLHHRDSGPAPSVAPGAATVSLAASWRGEAVLLLKESSPRLLVQLVVIVLATGVAGAAFRRLGSPAVVGEMAAGILLGPTLVGSWFPAAFQLVFPRESWDVLRSISQLGVTIFMFVAGMEFNAGYLKENARRSLLLSQIGVLAPFLLGLAAAPFLYRSYAGAGGTFPAFALFIGISMSITAFPVLIRILEERRMIQSPLGTIALACAAIDDVTAWGILALIVAFVHAAGLAAAGTKLGFLALYVVVMWFGVRPQLDRVLACRAPAGTPVSHGVLVAILLYMTGSALVTEFLGVHALFGAFVAGVCMPRRAELLAHLVPRLEATNKVLLLPLFFALSGLRTELGLLDGGDWVVCGGIIAIATAGKLGGCALSARVSGMRWRDALSFGALMNTRGLMELVVLNLGYDLGILSVRMFSVMIVMALVTTFLTGPLLALIAQARGVPAFGPRLIPTLSRP